MFDLYNKPDDRNVLDRTEQGIIGQPLDRPEGKLKVAGAATYAAEYPIDGCAEGFFVLSAIPQGKVRSIDAASVEGLPGVLGVFTDERMLRRPAQGQAGAAPQQDPATIEYFAQPIALVVAETFEQARAAAEALKVEYEPSDRPIPYDPESAAAKVEVPSDDKRVDAGDLDQAMKDAAYSVDVVYRTPGHASAAMEPHASIATWHNGHLTLYGSFQMLADNVRELADSLNIAPRKVRIVAPYVGGGFGSKLGISHDAVGAAIAARELGRPVRVNMTRQQVFQGIERRSETRQRVRLACDGNGRLIGFGHEALVSNLPNEDQAEPVTQASHFLYAGENRRIKVDVARISRLTAGSVRAPGEAVGMQVLEAAMDELAEQAGIEPIEFRKRNIPDTVPADGTPYSSRMLATALDRGAEAFGWDQRKPEPCQTRDGDWWIGMGVASAARVNMIVTAEARVTLRGDGSVLVESDQTDIGTGSYAVLGQIAGEMLGLPIAQVEVRLGDSELPPGAGSGGSFGASSTGSAVFRACETIREKLAGMLDCSPDELRLKDGMATCANRHVALADLLAGEEIVAKGRIRRGKTALDYNQASYGAFFAEVAVHVWTGEVRVRRMTGAFGFGRVLNAKTARSQCLGGMVWGIGSALTEELSFDLRTGRLANHDLADYHVPVQADVPALEVILLDEERDPAASPLQAKGVGELGICGAAGAIANAVYNACGVRVRDFPLTVDKIIGELPVPD